MSETERMAPKDWLDWTSTQQGLASDPARSAWVSANAGSGKTHVLTQRVIRLLLAGCRPSAILCLTYTKAAASEMSNRVFERLAEWAILDDTELSRRIEEIERRRPDVIQLKEARRLFARALETPGGLKIQTIHAFCEALLHQFPLEANVAGHFSVLDDRAAGELMEQARRSLLLAGSRRRDGPLADVFATVMRLADETGLDKLLQSFVGQRTALSEFFAYAERHGGVEDAVRASLGILPGECEDEIFDTALADPELLPHRIGAMIDLARERGGSKPQATAAALVAALALPIGRARFGALLSVFAKDDGEKRADGSFVAKPMEKADPLLSAAFLSLRDRFVEAGQRISLLSLGAATMAALSLGRYLIADYESLKKRRGLLDFEDLVNRTRTLLTRSHIHAWVHYKLDQGIDHVLVDEAQDTSPRQWEIIRSLTDEFFAGASQRGIDRTLFVVGDEKQSIYSFQGARPERFSAERRDVSDQIDAAGGAFSAIRLQLSFRSTEAVLSAVDTVFAASANARGLAAQGDPVVHASNRIGQPGVVEVWDQLVPAPGETDADWTAAFDATPETAPVNVLARRVANSLAAWIGRETVTIKGVTRPMEPGDIIVLVRKRDAFVAALTRALKRSDRAIPVAGADRLVLTEHIAVQDLVALGRFALLPSDDLSLAALLKSPLFNFDEDKLAAVATMREEGESLWQRLIAMAVNDDALEVIRQRLETLIEEARACTPFDFFARILGPLGGRAAFLARLGSEASDVLDEFLAFALDTEKSLPASLQLFLSTLEREAPTVKRELDKGRNEVRIMTVHAAKGLEAPVVFLVDSGAQVMSSQHAPALRLFPSADGPDAPTVPIWQAPGLKHTVLGEDRERLKDAAEQEYRRLLYVGMTRAADRLIVCGYRGKKAFPDTWHMMVRDALGADPRAAATTFTAGGESWEGVRWMAAASPSIATSGAEIVTARDVTVLPEALFRPPAARTRLPRPLAPSGAGIAVDAGHEPPLVATSLFSAPQKGAAAGLLRGAILHRLLQTLPDFEPDERLVAATRYLERAVPQWPLAVRQRTVEQVLAVLTDPASSGLFSDGSRAEVSVIGTLRLGRRDYAVSGRLDRLAVDGNRVVIADFKTNRDIPSDETEISPGYIAQLAIYRELLAPLYPDKVIDCVLVYTGGPRTFRLSPERLARSLDGLATK
ncbi:DNA helicase/exodeoxyribonuclease V, subunit A [Rhizobium sp. RU20A]|uniref:double-strand break repair helicase AddA n=1 Tax=Rhizobium sp. RU20A TaxID=1907412 RepID=UPI000955CB02|nr:double-strand break repair helicase AddA [Rhizobium sp. RU20A]SIQ83486.1 DNA helicase/exodeoxyribonuclease V, subunit A [Rhizobium sp. RU20A]